MRAAVGFLTIFGSSALPSPRTMRWFGVVGAFIGAFLGAVWVAAGELFAPLVAAGLVVLADLVVTGFLHLDGLADAGDGLIAPMDQQKRLAVMRTPDVGAFGVGVVVVVLGLRWAALASTEASWWFLAVVWALSRIFVAAVPAIVPYARDEGLASTFIGDNIVKWVPLAVLPSAAAGYVFGGAAVVAALVGLYVAAWGVVAFARRRLGGFTGDILGATILISETVALVVYSARW
ncbi:MAG: adenosylcobinamide-GDP ribazoletransferase [Acidimicrobiales bacterium]